MNERMEKAGGEGRDFTGARLGMWLFVVSEVFFFIGPFILYGAYRYRFHGDFVAASSALNLTLGALNTVILFTSSLSISLAVLALKRGKASVSAAFIAVTLALAAVFLVNKYFEWNSEIAHGIYPGSLILLQKPKGEILFWGLYYFTTGLHGLHVAVGVALFSAMLFLVLKGRVNSADYVKLENSGLYWHIVDVIWIFLFPFFYLVS